MVLSMPLKATEAAWPARTIRQGARFLFTDVTVTAWKPPSKDGPISSWSASRSTPLEKVRKKFFSHREQYKHYERKLFVIYYQSLQPFQSTTNHWTSTRYIKYFINLKQIKEKLNICKSHTRRPQILRLVLVKIIIIKNISKVPSFPQSNKTYQ